MVKKLYLWLYHLWSNAVADNSMFVRGAVERLWGVRCIYCTAWRAFLYGFGLGVVLFAGWPWKLLGTLALVVVWLIVEGEKRYVPDEEQR